MHLFELRANCSLTTGTATIFFLSVLVTALPVAGACAMLGFWPVLPFAGLELIGLAVALRLSLQRGQAREFIQIDERCVLVARSSRGREEQVRFARPWTRVRLSPSQPAHWPSRLSLCSMGRSVEVGTFLTETERRSLGRRLAEVLGSPPVGLQRLPSNEWFSV